jgi:hypothetical protein
MAKKTEVTQEETPERREARERDERDRAKKYPDARDRIAEMVGVEDFDHPHSDHHADEPSGDDPEPTLATASLAVENDDSYYQKTGVEVPIAGYVLDRVAYYFVDNAQYTVDSGRLNDPDVVRWLHGTATIKPVRSEYTAFRNQAFQTVPLNTQGLPS